MNDGQITELSFELYNKIFRKYCSISKSKYQYKSYDILSGLLCNPCVISRTNFFNAYMTAKLLDIKITTNFITLKKAQ